MAHPNEELIRGAFGAFSRGNLQAVEELFDEDIVWHVPGRGPRAATYRGKHEVLGFLRQSKEMTGGTFRLDLHDVVANDEHGVALVVVRAESGGNTLEDRGVNVMHMRDGKVTEVWIHAGDQSASDEFEQAAMGSPTV